MSAVKQLIVGVISILFIINSEGKPIFLNHTFISSLLGASSGSQQSFQDNPESENIAIVSKSQKLQQNYHEQNDNSSTFPTESSANDFDLTTIRPINGEPSLLKMKLNKIIQKIVTLSQIQQAFTGKLRDQSSFMYPYTPDLDDKDIRISKEYGAPLKIDLTRNNNELNGIGGRKNSNLAADEKNGKIEPSTLGVFLFEVFASLIGLSLGAAGQINYHLAQNNTV